MISSERARASGAARLVLLTVLLGLLGMHALTAHGSDHHGAVAPMAAHAGVAHDAQPPAMSDSGPEDVVGRITAPGSVFLAPALDHVPAVSPGSPGDTAGLVLCWLLLTAGVALLALLLCGLRSAAPRARIPAATTVTGPGRPRAPPGRVRLLELAILRV